MTNKKYFADKTFSEINYMEKGFENANFSKAINFRINPAQNKILGASFR